MSHDVRQGALVGLIVGIGYAAIAGVGLAIMGGVPSRLSDRVTVPALLLTYVLSGVAGGILAGLLSPLVTSRWRSALVGGISFLPGMIACVTLVSGPMRGWDGADWTLVLIMSSVLGGLGGARYWDHGGAMKHAASEAPPRKKTRGRRAS